jgi:hypothetical protein
MKDTLQAPALQDIPEGLSGDVLVINPAELLTGDVIFSTASGLLASLPRPAQIHCAARRCDSVAARGAAQQSAKLPTIDRKSKSHRVCAALARIGLD